MSNKIRNTSAHSRKGTLAKSPILEVQDPAVLSMDGIERAILSPAPLDDADPAHSIKSSTLKPPPLGVRSQSEQDRGRLTLYERALSHSSTDPNVRRRSGSQGLRTPSPSPGPPLSPYIRTNFQGTGNHHESLFESPKAPPTARRKSKESIVRVTNESAVQKWENEKTSRNAQNLDADCTQICVSTAAAIDRPLMGTRVSEGHENFVTAYNMLTGIRVAVSRCNAKLNRELVSADFADSMEFSFDLAGDYSTPSTKYMFRFKDYSPWVFRHLRELFGLDPADYLMSLTAKYIVSELGSPGKSGSFFYYSRDYRFIIKTVHHAEHKQLRKILPDYHSHVRKYHNTLLSQFYGLHRVKLPFGRKIHFVVMNNVFPAVYEMHSRFDLKGSTLGRACRLPPNTPKSAVVQKDLDWLKAHERIVLGPSKRKQLLKQLELDVGFLVKQNVMDYSLLIGTHDVSKGNSALNALLKLKEFGPSTDQGLERVDHNYGNVSRRENQEFQKLQTLLRESNPTALKNVEFNDSYRKSLLFYHDKGGFQSTDENDQPLDLIYYMGVIDFLTPYNSRKKIETFCKSLIHKRGELSAVPASEYGHRFYRFMSMSVGSAMCSNPQSRAEYDKLIASSPSASAFAQQAREEEERAKQKARALIRQNNSASAASAAVAAASGDAPLNFNNGPTKGLFVAPALKTPQSSPLQGRARSLSSSSMHSVATAHTISSSETRKQPIISSKPSAGVQIGPRKRASAASFGAPLA